MNWLDSLLRSQFGQPSGLFGSMIVAPMLNAGNIRMVKLAVEMLAPKPDAAILDIGFGGGSSLVAMASAVPEGTVTGVDYSRDMVANAKRMVRQRRLRPRVIVRWGDVARLPFDTGTFDGVVSLNSLYYWPDLNASLREIARVLKRRGRVAIGFHSPTGLRLITKGWADFALYEPEEMAGHMRAAGFEVLRVEQRDRWLVIDTVVVVGRKR